MKGINPQESYSGKYIVIIGASGGLGESFVKLFADRGAKLLLAVRNSERLQQLASQTPGAEIATVDVTLVDSIEGLAERIRGWADHVDIVINASGYDVRKSLAEHNGIEIKKTLEINLLGPVLLTKMFLPLMKDVEESVIVHIGGFADGRLAFPYYSADAASRSGLFTFVEAINREQKTENKKARIAYFCPSPTETEAERPFHPLWRKMGIAIVPTEMVGQELLKLVESKKTVRIMGGFITIFFAKVNSVWPSLADFMMMRTYGKMLRDFLYGEKPPILEVAKDKKMEPKSKKTLLSKVAVVLVVLSFVFYGLIPIVPFFPFTVGQKAMIIPALIAFGEASWWIGLLILGKAAMSKYRRFLNPCNWCSSKKA